MSDITVELIAILLLATAVGWFLGRVLTKNKEVEERSINRQLTQQINALTTEQNNTQQLLNQTQLKHNEASKLTTELEQALNNAEVRQQSLHSERKTLLTKLQDLEVSHSRLESIAEEYHSQTKSLLALQTEHSEQEADLHTLQTRLNHKQQLIDDNTAHIQQQKNQLSEIRRENAQHLDKILELEKDRKALKLLQLDYSEAQSNINMLEEDKASLHQRHTDLRSEHQDLRLQCDTLRSDSLKFNDRLGTLMKEKEALTQTIEQLNIEKNDYLGRLRAISGVIDVVGTEKLSADTNNQAFIPRQPVIIK